MLTAFHIPSFVFKSESNSLSVSVPESYSLSVSVPESYSLSVSVPESYSLSVSVPVVVRHEVTLCGRRDVKIAELNE